MMDPLIDPHRELRGTEKTSVHDSIHWSVAFHVRLRLNKPEGRFTHGNHVCTRLTHYLPPVTL